MYTSSWKICYSAFVSFHRGLFLNFVRPLWTVYIWTRALNYLPLRSKTLRAMQAMGIALDDMLDIAREQWRRTPTLTNIEKTLFFLRCAKRHSVPHRGNCLYKKVVKVVFSEQQRKRSDLNQHKFACLNFQRYFLSVPLRASTESVATDTSTADHFNFFARVVLLCEWL